MADELNTSTYLQYTSAEKRSESFHQEFGFALIIFLLLLSLSLLFIWFFKHYRFRLFHETGVAMIMGIIFGLFLHLYFLNIPSQTTPTLKLCDLETRVVFTKDDFIWLLHNDTTLEITVGRIVSNNESPEDRIESLFLFDPETFFYILLPPIIFFAGYSMKKRHFFRNIFSLLTYAFIGTTISTFVIGTILYAYVLLGFESFPNEFNLLHGLLFGSLISATDPVTVLAIFHDLHVDVDLYALVFGESVMNDAVAIVLYRAIDQFEEEFQSEFVWWQILVSIDGRHILKPKINCSNSKLSTVYQKNQRLMDRKLDLEHVKFVGIFVGSFILGITIGVLSAIFLKLFQLREQPLIETSFFVVISYFTFPLAEAIELTGIVAILFCGIAQSHYTYINLSLESRTRTKEVFELLSFLSENFLFSYMGVSLFTFPYHQWKPGFIAFAFVGIAIGRILNIVPISLFLNIRRRKKIPWTFQAMLLFAGLRGAIAFAIAIRNTDTEIRQLFYTTTLIIVLVTIVICGGSTYFVLMMLKIRVGVKEDRSFKEDGEIIQYDPIKGNLLVSKFTYFDKHYFIPFFTIRGISLLKLFPRWSHFIIRTFDRNKLCSNPVSANLQDLNFMPSQIMETEESDNNEPDTK